MRSALIAAVCALALVLAACGLAGCASADAAEDGQGQSSAAEQPESEAEEPVTLRVFASIELVDPVSELAAAFEARTGDQVEVTFADADQLAERLAAGEECDVIVTGSRAQTEALGAGSDYRVVAASHVPVVAVSDQCPFRIVVLKALPYCDRIVVGNAATSVIGVVGNQVLGDAGLTTQLIDQGALATASSSEQMVAQLAAGQADIAIVWREDADVEGVEVADRIDLSAYAQQVSVLAQTNAANREEALAFVDFASGDSDALAIWRNCGFC